MNDGWRMTNAGRTGRKTPRCLRVCHSLPSAPVQRDRSTFVFRDSSFRTAGFTLVEIVIAMTILIIIAAATIPTFRGLRAEQQAREPVEQLTRMAKEARLRAMREKRPYQIVFHATGFTASRYLSPYLQLAELNDFLIQVEQKALEPPPEVELSNQANVTRPTGDQIIYTKTADSTGKFEDWVDDYKLPEGMHYTVQYWYDLEAMPIEGEVVKLWVFQPSGICLPLTVHLENEAAIMNIEYGALTADIIKEISEIK